MKNTAPGALAPASPFAFSPAINRSSVDLLKVTVQAVTPVRNGNLNLDVTSGNTGFGVTVPALPGRPDFNPGDRLILEFQKGANPLLSPCSAIYHEHARQQKTMPARNENMSEMHTLPVVTDLTMTSLEISVLVDSRHDKVKQSIERLADRGVISLPPMGEVKIQRERREESVQVYKLCKRDSLIVVAQLCPEFTAKIVDRWQELEEQLAKPQSLNPASLSRLQLIELAMQAEQERLALEHKVEELEPKAEALDRIADADGTMNLTLAAKSLQAQPKKFFDWLREKHWIYRRPGGSGNVAYQDKIQAGLLTHKVTTVQREDGTEKVVEQVLVTGKGLAKLAQMLGVATNDDFISGSAA